MQLIKVNGVALPTPSLYYDDVEFLENSTRNANATLVREIIAKKMKIELQWNYLTRAQFAQLRAIRELKSFTCQYWNHTTNAYDTITCYAGKLSGTPLRADSGGVKDWQDVSINFIEY